METGPNSRLWGSNPPVWGLVESLKNIEYLSIALQSAVHSAICWRKHSTEFILLSLDGHFKAALLGLEQQASLILDTFTSLGANCRGCECVCVCVYVHVDSD